MSPEFDAPAPVPKKLLLSPSVAAIAGPPETTRLKINRMSVERTSRPWRKLLFSRLKEINQREHTWPGNRRKPKKYVPCSLIFLPPSIFEAETFIRPLRYRSSSGWRTSLTICQPVSLRDIKQNPASFRKQGFSNQPTATPWNKWVWNCFSNCLRQLIYILFYGPAIIEMSIVFHKCPLKVREFFEVSEAAPHTRENRQCRKASLMPL